MSGLITEVEKSGLEEWGRDSGQMEEDPAGLLLCGHGESSSSNSSSSSSSSLGSPFYWQELERVGLGAEQEGMGGWRA